MVTVHPLCYSGLLVLVKLWPQVWLNSWHTFCFGRMYDLHFQLSFGFGQNPSDHIQLVSIWLLAKVCNYELLKQILTTCTLILINELTGLDAVDVTLPCTEPALSQCGVACRRWHHWICRPVAVCQLTVHWEACEQMMLEQWQTLHHQHLPLCSTAP